jgi:hypothetical protein
MAQPTTVASAATVTAHRMRVFRFTNSDCALAYL